MKAGSHYGRARPSCAAVYDGRWRPSTQKPSKCHPFVTAVAQPFNGPYVSTVQNVLAESVILVLNGCCKDDGNLPIVITFIAM